MPPQPKKPAGGKKRGKGEVVEVAVVEESPTIVPADQCKLTAKQLDEDMTRVLTATNPHTPHNLVSYKCVPPLGGL
jgi:hypothetical protein